MFLLPFSPSYNRPLLSQLGAVLLLVLSAGLSLAAVLPSPNREVAQPTSSAGIPKVYLSEQHQQMCRVKVGDTFPELAFTPTDQRGTSVATLNTEMGQQVTVVVLWDRASVMAQTLLRDLGPDVIEPFANAGEGAVAVVAVAVGPQSGRMTSLARQLGYTGPLFVDPQGQAFAELGSGRMPRVYVIDGQGVLRWFDIEYSQATRRELRQTLQTLVQPAK